MPNGSGCGPPRRLERTFHGIRSERRSRAVVHNLHRTAPDRGGIAMSLRSLQSRILALFLLVIIAVQVGGFVLVNTVGGAAARNTIGEELVAGARVFDRLLEEDTQRLVQGARVLAADYAFREAIGTRERETIRSALVNHGKRIDADVMMLIGLDDRVIANTLDVGPGEKFSYPRLIGQARTAQQAAAMVVIRDQLYQLVIVPVMAPVPIAWVAVGFNVNDALAQDLRGLTRLDVSFLSRNGREPWALQASTLPEAGRLPLLVDVAGGNFAPIDKDGNTMLGNAAVTRILPLRTPTDEVVIAVLQQPLATALEPFRRLQRQLAWTSLLAVVISILAGVLISRGIAWPVRELADSARRIAAGDYSNAPPTSNTQEIADLAAAFRTMQEGIATREAQIMDLAYRDTLTGLPNRTLFGDRLSRQLLAAQDTGTSVAVLLMDLDHFKYVNDTLGHPIGDLLLAEVANRLQAVVDRPGDTVARLGGDEFAILLPHMSVADAQIAASAILGALEAPMTLEGHIVDVRANVGIAVFPEHGREAATLLRHADVAMYEAKRANAGVVVFDQRYDLGSHDRLSLMSDLRKAVDRDELTLVYQPKVSLRDASGRHVEALVRWRHPTRGLVAPSEFIPFAEQTGYIRSITMWVLSRAIAQCAAWRAEGLPMHVSINISARDVMDAQLPDRVVALLESHGCAARWISFEITESAILDDPGHAVANLNRLHALGCQIAIDDYGTGYSSLAYLRRLPLHELKIDKSFVMGMSGDANDDVIVRSTIELAHNMHLMVVAEGVEDEPTLERLRALGCDMAQGFHLSRPVTPDQAAAWARDSIASRAMRETNSLRRVV
jgi:diguanylate cyclase (GGDEF)-like protein